MENLFLITSGEYSDYTWHIAVIGNKDDILASLKDLSAIKRDYYKKGRELRNNWVIDKFGIDEKVASNKFHTALTQAEADKYREAAYATPLSSAYDDCPITQKYRELEKERDKFQESIDYFSPRTWLKNKGFIIVPVKEIHISYYSGDSDDIYEVEK